MGVLRAMYRTGVSNYSGAQTVVDSIIVAEQTKAAAAQQQHSKCILWCPR